MRKKIVFKAKEIKKIEEVARSLDTKQLAAYFGIGQTTLFEIFKRQPEVYEAYKKARSVTITDAVSKLFEKIEAGDTASIIFFLKTQAGWSETQKLVTEDVSERPTRIILEAADDSQTTDTE